MLSLVSLKILCYSDIFEPMLVPWIMNFFYQLSYFGSFQFPDIFFHFRGHQGVRPFTMKFLEGGVLENKFPRAIPKLLPLRGGLLYTSIGYVVLELSTLI